MKNAIKLLVIILILFTGCAEKKATDKIPQTETTEFSMEGMWKLKSGVWDNEDGTFLRYPEDSITQGEAFNIYSKTHFMTIAKAPLMEYFRGELTAYSIEGDKIAINTKISNFGSNEGKEATWTFKVEGNTIHFELGKNKETWEKVE